MGQGVMSTQSTARWPEFNPEFEGAEIGGMMSESWTEWFVMHWKRRYQRVWGARVSPQAIRDYLRHVKSTTVSGGRPFPHDLDFPAELEFAFCFSNR